MLRDETSVDPFTEFMREAEPRIRRALTAAFGSQVGREASAEAVSYGWQNWGRVGVMENPTGYLFRVGQHKARRMRQRREPVDQMSSGPEDPWIEPGLAPAMERLSERQRTVVSLLHAFDWTMSEVAEFLGLSKASVQTYEARAMKKLKSALGVQQ